MKFPDIQLPSNRKFGFFFTFVFAVASSYLLFIESLLWAQAIAILGVTFLLITLTSSQLLLPLNKLWMRFGVLLGMIISPFILGIIFILLITPYGMVMRVFGRDELNLKKKNLKTYWITRAQKVPQTDFTQQF